MDDRFGAYRKTEIAAGPYRGYAVPELGGQLMSLTYRGIKILHEPASPEDFAPPRSSTWYGIPILFPPNRIDGGRFTLEGKTYQFPVNEPKRGNSLHGFLHTRPFELTRFEAEGLSCVLEMAFESKSDPSLFEYLPFDFAVTMRYELSEEGLLQVCTVENRSDSAMPLGLGYHTSFEAEEGTKVLLSVGQRIPVNERMLPEGEERDLTAQEALLRKGGLPYDAWEMDDHYTAKPLEDGFLGAKVYRRGLTICYETDPFFRHFMVWNGWKREGLICLEPQNWRINAPNEIEKIGKAAGMDFVPAGGRVSAATKLYAHFGE